MKKLLTAIIVTALLLAILPVFAVAAEDVLVNGVSLDKSELALKKAETAQLTAAVWPEDATDKSVTWTSSADAVATVDNGLVTAKSVGTATITATANDGSGVYASCTVAVSDGGTWGGIDWTLTADGTLTIAPTTGTPVPDPNSNKIFEVGAWREAVRYDSGGVGRAIEGWPYDRTKVKKLVIEEGVTSIGSFTAQSFTNLTGEVVIPSSVNYIGQEAFQKSPMTKLTFAAGGTETLCIGPGAFKSLAIEELTLPTDRPLHIHCWAFSGCTALKRATIPANVTEMALWTHVDYCGMDYVDWSHGSASYIFSSVASLETITFGNAEVMKLFYSYDNGGSKDAIKANTGLTAYCDLQAAIDAAAESGDAVTLVKGVTVASGKTIEIPEGVTLDLNGKTLTNNGVIANFGAITGDGTVKNNGDYANGDNATNNAKMTGEGDVCEIYSIIYNLDGGTVTTPNPAYYIEGHEGFTLNDPTKTGYAFAGWTGSGLSEATTPYTVPADAADDLAYTANWTPHTYSISFNANGGVGTMETVENVGYDTAVELPANAFTKSGCYFAGWNTAADGSGTSYANKASVSNMTDEDGGTVTLYAKWNKIIYVPYVPPTYTVDVSEGVQISLKRAEAGETVTVTIPEGMEADGIRILDNKDNLVRVSGSEGVFKFDMPRGNVKIETFTNPFNDVSQNEYYYNPAIWAIANEITMGVSEDEFAPDVSGSRTQMITFLWRAAGSPEPKMTDCPFTDVDMDSFYGKAVLWAIENGITSGISETLFGSDAECSRAQIVTFLFRMADGKAKSDNGFIDVDADAYYAEAVQWAAENGITMGTGDNIFSPDISCSRGQMVTFLYRYFAEI